MTHLPRQKTQKSYPHIAVVYANTDTEAEKLLYAYEKQGYQRTKDAGERNMMGWSFCWRISGMMKRQANLR